MIILGVCGRSGSGKSTVCEYFAKKGLVWIDCDKIYRRLTETRSDCLTAIEKEFGAEVIDRDRLDRKKMAQIVFHSSEKRAKLNEITHYFVLKEVNKALILAKKQAKKAAVLDVPLLFESGFDKICDITIGVIAKDNTALERIKTRDKISESEADLRLSAQISNSILREKCRYILQNDADLFELYRACDALLNTIGL